MDIVVYETPQREINLKRMTRNLAFLLNFGRRVGHNHRLEKQDREEGKMGRLRCHITCPDRWQHRPVGDSGPTGRTRNLNKQKKLNTEQSLRQNVARNELRVDPLIQNHIGKGYVSQ